MLHFQTAKPSCTVNNTNLIIIDIYRLGINKVIDVKREKIFKSYLTVNIQITLAKVIKN